MPIHVISRDRTANTGVASIRVLENNENRTYASFINNSANIIWLAKADVALVNQGIRLNANGGSYEITPLNPWKGRVAAIAAGAASVLCITEDEAREYTT